MGSRRREALIKAAEYQETLAGVGAAACPPCCRRTHAEACGQALLSHVTPLSSPSAHFLLMAQLHFTDCCKCFIGYWRGACPRGRIPYEKCIPTAVWACLHSHVRLIKASRKSIGKQPYLQCLCSGLFLFIL